MNKFIFHLMAKNEKVQNLNIPAYVFRAALMNILSRIDSKFVNQLHESNKIRPYAISIKRKEDHLLFILKILKEQLSKTILNYIISTSNFELKIYNLDFILLKTDFESVKFENLIKNAKKIGKFRLNFLTPTYFNISGRDFVMRFPEPTFIFENLARVWNDFAPLGCKIDSSGFYDWIKKNIFVSSFDLRTKPYNIGKKDPVVGCIGWANYIIKNPNQSYSPWIDVLLKFAEYSNIGGNRTAACGIIRYNPLEILDKTNKT